MTESDVLLQAAAVVLLLCLAYHHPGLSGRLGRGGFAVLIAGALVPVLDLVWFYLRASDRIEFLTQPPMVAGLCYGTLLIGAVAALAGFLIGPERAGRTFVLLMGGFLLYQALELLTPAGAPLFSPFLPRRVALPLFPVGHPLLVGALLVMLVAHEALPRFRRSVGWVSAALLGLYVVAGGGQYAHLTLKAAELAPPGTELSVEPDDPWLHRWLITVTERGSYQMRRQGIEVPQFGPPEELQRWNDEALLIRLLSDPTVERFFQQVFRHPVVRVEATDLRVTLIMQEAEDQAPPVPGPTFYYEVDHEGHNRFYQVQRFD